MVGADVDDRQSHIALVAVDLMCDGALSNQGDVRDFGRVRGVDLKTLSEGQLSRGAGDHGTLRELAVVVEEIRRREKFEFVTRLVEWRHVERAVVTGD